MLREKSNFILILFLLFSSSIFAQRSTTVLAVISDVQGDVFLKKAQNINLLRAVFGMQLIQGDLVKTEKKASVSMLFSNGNLISLGPSSSITISGNQSNDQARNIGVELASNFSDLALRQDSKGEMGVLIDLRSDETAQQIVPLSPCNTMIPTNKPGLSWESKKPADEFVVRLYNSQGLVWEKRTKDTHLEFPDDVSPLTHGESYFWNVEGEDLIHSFKSLNQKFTILSQEKIKEIAIEKKKLFDLFADDSESSSLHSLLGTYYANSGLYEDAIKEFETVRDANPDATLPHEILGGLYNDVGKKDLAIAELQKALAIEKEK